MTSKELIKYLVNPDLLSESTVTVLQEMLDEYPYFEVLRMLYLKNLCLIRDLRFSGELRKAALLLSDRALLFRLIHEKVSPFALCPPNRTEQDRTLALIDAYFAGKAEIDEADLIQEALNAENPEPLDPDETNEDEESV